MVTSLTKCIWKKLFDEDSYVNKVSKQNYDNLEKVLQKYEAEIRDHIRVE